jgi:hypothetical protein
LNKKIFSDDPLIKKKRPWQKHLFLEGDKNPMFGRKGNLHPKFGKRLSEETRAKMRGRHLSEETKSKMSQAKRGEKHPLWKGTKATKNAGRNRARIRFKCPEGMERHHVDGNPLNNSPENIAFVTHERHMYFHLQELQRPRCSNGTFRRQSKVM